jgi:lipopolysaccharide/colanic/teichoic acid biosynthesis glycosyltransferase
MSDHRPKAEVTPSPWLQNPLRGFAERSIAGLGLLALSPLIAACALAVRCESRGRGFYRQERVGLGGRRFHILKIRTMVSDAEAGTGPVWSIGADPRVTPLGRFLRRSHLDELPQLWNVLCGDMSIVGPRPERPIFTQQLSNDIPDYVQRLAIRPGITGLAQVSQGPDRTREDVARKVAYDLAYIRTATLTLDLILVAKTIAPKLVPAPKATGQVRRLANPTTSSTKITPV